MADPVALPRAESPFLRNLRDLPGFLNTSTIAHGFVAWFFAVSGPLLILLNAARLGGLPARAVEGWIAVGYGVGGVLTILLSLMYGMPIAGAWSISGAVLVGGFLSQHALPEAVGVYVAAGVLSLILGMTGALQFILDRIPPPVILGMVAGVLLPFGIHAVKAAEAAPLYAGGAIIAYFAGSASPRLARRVPPIVWAVIVGVALANATSAIHWQAIELRVARPLLIAPTFSFAALAELLVPLTLTMVVVQDAQTVAILKSAGNARPPTNSIVAVTGLGTLVGSFFGSHSYCTAPVMCGILSSDEVQPAEGRYAAAVVSGLLFLPFALLAPAAAAAVTAFPAPLVQVLGGLALLPVLVQSLGKSFEAPLRQSALIAFVVTLSNVTLWHVGAPFWGIVLGALAAFVLERPRQKKNPS